MQGRSVDEYRAPLFLAWQLTNRCSARCLACCEESGPDKAWRDELDARRGAGRSRSASSTSGIPYVAFGGGEPLGVAALLGDLRAARRRPASRSSSRPTAAASTTRPPTAWRRSRVQCVQISVDGATAATHERVRPGIELRRRHRARSSASSRAGARRSSCSSPPASTSTRSSPPTTSRSRWAASAFVTGPMMRIGRAAAAWDAHRAARDDEWQRAVDALRERARRDRRDDRAVDLSLGHRHRDGARGWKARRRCCWSCPTAR